jgi:methionyl-tRNA formyltransferase
MEEIEAIGAHLEVVVTLHDGLAISKSGRVFVDDFCESHGAELVKIRHIGDHDALTALRAADLDWLFIIGWSQIAASDVLSIPRKGALGMHPTLLPVGRGRASIPWAIIKGLDETGVTLFQLDEGVDTGPIIGQHRLPLSPTETATTLYERVAEAHRVLIRDTWPQLVADTVVPRPQDESKATEWPGRRPEDGRITADMPVDEVDRLVRGVTRPYPGAFWDARARRLRVWAGRRSQEMVEDPALIQCRDGFYLATEFEWEGLTLI